MKSKHFCGNCGKQNVSAELDDLGEYKWKEVCHSCGHEVHLNQQVPCEKCESGMALVRATSKHGYQTVHISKKLEKYKDELTDKNFHKVCIFGGFINNK